MPLVLNIGGQSLSLYTAVTTLCSPVDITLSELRLETYFPADDATRAFMEQMAS